MLSTVRTEAEVWLKRAANRRRLGEYLQLQDADAAGTDRFQRLVVPVRPGDGRILCLPNSTSCGQSEMDTGPRRLGLANCYRWQTSMSVYMRETNRTLVIYGGTGYSTDI